MQKLQEDSFDILNNDDSMDEDFLKEMFKYETNARKETESIEMSVEEENMIVSKIKKELLNQVRGEMQSELEIYQQDTFRTDTTAPDYVEEMDPVIRKGLYEIKRLDKILLRKMQREKEVKRERILLQKRLKEELNEIEDRNSMLSKEIKYKVEQFLSIKPPPKHNEGLNETTAEEECPKLFQTEILSESIYSSSHDQESQPSSKSANTSVGRSNKSQHSNDTKTSKNSNSRNIKVENQRKKNFIKRNIELASKAGEPVVFTEEENNRLQYLLADLNDDESLMAAVNENYIKSLTDNIEENPFQVATLDHYSQNGSSDCSYEEGSLSALCIDSDLTSIKYQLSVESRLKHYMGEDRYSQLSRVEDRGDFSESVIYQMPRDCEEDGDFDCFGEKTLKELKYSRESQERLKEIDNLLNNLKEGCEENPRLDSEVLKDLISSSRGNMSASNFSEFSDVESLTSQNEINMLDNGVEHLSRDILDSLLKEAAEYNKRNKRLELISEQTELSEETTLDPSQRSLESRSRSTSSECSYDKPSSRFPDIHLYKHMTSSISNYK